MGIGCQRNGYWAATNHLSGRGLVQPIKELSSAARRCAGRGCALIRQLANALVIDVEGTLVLAVGSSLQFLRLQLGYCSAVHLTLTALQRCTISMNCDSFPERE